jgi:CRP-like cAMP-binding protein
LRAEGTLMGLVSSIEFQSSGGADRKPSQGSPDLASALRVLASQGWFSQRSKATRDRLSDIGRLRKFAGRDLICQAGGPPVGLFGLVSGTVSISLPRGDGERYTVKRSDAGFWSGNFPPLSYGLRFACLHTVSPTVMVHLSHHDLTRLVREDPRLYADLFELSTETLQTAFRLISNLTIASADKRLADRLLLELETRGDSDGWIPAPQTERAELINVSLPTVQRVLRRFHQDGLVVSGYGRIRVIDRPALAKLCLAPGYP